MLLYLQNDLFILFIRSMTDLWTNTVYLFISFVSFVSFNVRFVRVMEIFALLYSRGQFNRFIRLFNPQFARERGVTATSLYFGVKRNLFRLFT